MKKNYQKQLRRLAAMLLVAMLVPVAAWSQGSYTLNGVRYVYGTVDGVPVAIVSGFTTEFLESSDELSTEIPCNIAPNAEYPMDRYPVRFPSEAAQNYGVFMHDLNKLKTKLVELSIGTGSFNGEVLEVPSKLFATSPKLKKVTIEACNLGEEAFAECLQLDNINFIFTYATKLGNRCFAGCTALETLYVVNGVEIGEGCFENCTKLTEASFEPCVRIGDYAFSGCSALMKLTFKNEIGRDGDANYSGFHSDSSYEHYLGTFSFGDRSGDSNDRFNQLREVVFEKPSYSNVKCVTSIPSRLFENMDVHPGQFNNLRTIQLPSHCPSIQDRAFRYLPALQEITIPATVTDWGYETFSACDNLIRVTFEDGLKTIGESMMAYSGSTDQSRLEIPGSVEKIGYKAFMGTKFTRVTLNEGLKVIGGYAFQSCDRIKEINLPESLEEIGDIAFSSTDLRTIVLPDKCLTLGLGCFSNCQELTTVRFPRKIEEIPDYAFQSCYKLEDLVFPLYSYDYNHNYLRKIGAYAFQGTGLKNLILRFNSYYGGGVIGDNTFEGCKKLETVYFENVQEIGVNAFASCKMLKEIKLPSGVRKIGSRAFGAYDSSDKMALKVLDMSECNKLASIPDFMCANDNNLESVIFPKDHYLAAVSQAAFANCTKLKNLVLPEKVDLISQSAFANCYAENYWVLDTDPLPFEEMADNEATFAYNDYDYPCPFVNMLKDGTHVFTDAILWVPKGTKSKYQKTEGWRLFKEIKEFEEAEAPDPLYPTADPYNLIYNYEGGNVTVCIDPDAGDGYNEEEQCLQLLSNISDLDDDRKWYWDAEDAEKDPEGYAEHCAWMKSRFRGITLRVVGKGKLIIDYEALGVMKMYVRFGDEKKKVYPIDEGTGTPKAEVIEIPFNRPEPIDVFIYPKTYSDHKASKRRRAEDVENEDTENDGMLKLFSVKVGTDDDATGIESITTIFDANAPVYDLNGRRVNAKNLKRGVYVRQGKKVVEK